MDDARKKLRVCLIFVVAVAVIFGVIYYFNDIKGKGSVSEGTLVKNERLLMDGKDIPDKTGFPDKTSLPECVCIPWGFQEEPEGRG